MDELFRMIKVSVGCFGFIPGDIIKVVPAEDYSTGDMVVIYIQGSYIIREYSLTGGNNTERFINPSGEPETIDDFYNMGSYVDIVGKVTDIKRTQIIKINNKMRVVA